MSDTEPHPSLFAPFKHNIYRRVWIANLVTSFGGLIQMTGASWMMTSISSSSQMVALVQASTTLPIMLFALLSGALSDNHNQRTIMLVANLFMLSVSALLVLSAFLGTITPWQLLAFTFLVGCGLALNIPAWQASVGNMVPRTELASAVLLNNVSFNLCRSVAPALGGMILALGGVIAAFSINAASYLGMIGVLWRWRPEQPRRELPREQIGRAMWAGIRYVTMSPNILKIMMRGLLFGLAAVANLALLPLVARDLLHGGPMTYGFLLGFFGIGGMIGAFISGRLRSAFSNETITRGTFVTFALCATGLALSRDLWLSNLSLVLGGASWVAALSLFNVTVQLSTPRWVLARVLSIYLTALYAGLALGSWLWGNLADRYGTQNALLISAALLIAGAAIGLLYDIPARSSLNLDPLHTKWAAPKIELDLKPSSGPVVIHVEYLIRPEDVPEFLSAMDERRRIRLRDGAQNWILMRDMQNPQSWMMSYRLPTWVEYLRHYRRTTQADAEVEVRILRLHQGAEKPKIQRLIERQTDWAIVSASDLHHLPPDRSRGPGLL
ncbi:MAG TPA: MFS transporter [Chthoniobacteraceae bacterium]|nr:MFS transporter [Chthoniobacteraceae bacterium]